MQEEVHCFMEALRIPEFTYSYLFVSGPPVEDFCGVEPITHPPEPMETRPPLDIDQDKVLAAYHETNSAFIGSKRKYNKTSLVMRAL